MEQEPQEGPRASALGDRDPTERLSADDQATLREEQFLAAALRAQQDNARAVPHNPGRCRYCGERCLPCAVYCDEECRADDEAEQQIRRRQGLAR